MMDQVGPKRLWRELKEQAPYYSRMLPELPRLMHAYLERKSRQPDQQEILRLLAEQKRTNRLLQGLIYALVGFVLGLLVMQLIVRVRLF